MIQGGAVQPLVVVSLRCPSQRAVPRLLLEVVCDLEEGRIRVALMLTPYSLDRPQPPAPVRPRRLPRRPEQSPPFATYPPRWSCGHLCVWVRARVPLFRLQSEESPSGGPSSWWQTGRLWLLEPSGLGFWPWLWIETA
jgi:hypothetical protein